jgi:hypothetical protein
MTVDAGYLACDPLVVRHALTRTIASVI